MQSVFQFRRPGVWGKSARRYEVSTGVVAVAPASKPSDRTISI